MRGKRVEVPRSGASIAEKEPAGTSRTPADCTRRGYERERDALEIRARPAVAALCGRDQRSRLYEDLKIS
ncbi:MAG TPA: hypothetical protein VMY42_26625, partial [Thermoguttaceae bacterium]|nr:hypothetical protein [Thermoguttaceae bacterium]